MSESGENSIQDGMLLGNQCRESDSVLSISHSKRKKKTSNFSWLLRNIPGLSVIVMLLTSCSGLLVDDLTSLGSSFFIYNMRMLHYRSSENSLSSKGMIINIRNKSPRCKCWSSVATGRPIVTHTVFSITVNQKCFMMTKMNTKRTINSIINSNNSITYISCLKLHY